MTVRRGSRESDGIVSISRKIVGHARYGLQGVERRQKIAKEQEERGLATALIPYVELSMAKEEVDDGGLGERWRECGERKSLLTTGPREERKGDPPLEVTNRAGGGCTHISYSG